MNTLYSHQVSLLGRRLWALALDWSKDTSSFHTVAERDNAIKAVHRRKSVINGSRSIKAARVAVETVASDLRGARRAARAFARRVAGKSVALPSLVERLERFRTTAVMTTVEAAYRMASHGSLEVVLTRRPAEVGVRQTEDFLFERSSHRTRNWRTRYQYTVVTAPADWRVRVAKRGLSCVDGMMTLDASPLDGAPQGVQLYAATWIVQGRGTDLRTVQGVIAKSGKTAFHGRDPVSALEGLKRKQKAQWLAELTLSDLGGVIAQVPTAIIRVKDAQAIGACLYGIESWCNRTGLPFQQGWTTLEAAYKAYLQDPAPEARAAILAVLKRSRQQLRLAA